MGSPPQVRGKLSLLSVLLLMMRITPAGAGKTFPASRLWTFRWDHPRRCGENSGLLFSFSAFAGSPPQVRGKLYWNCAYFHLFRDHPRRCGENQNVAKSRRLGLGSPPQVRGKPLGLRVRSPPKRITPAGAGKTFTKYFIASFVPDHPRRCGENFGTLPV